MYDSEFCLRRKRKNKQRSNNKQNNQNKEGGNPCVQKVLSVDLCWKHKHRISIQQNKQPNKKRKGSSNQRPTISTTSFLITEQKHINVCRGLLTTRGLASGRLFRSLFLLAGLGWCIFFVLELHAVKCSHKVFWKIFLRLPCILTSTMAKA